MDVINNIGVGRVRWEPALWSHPFGSRDVVGHVVIRSAVFEYLILESNWKWIG